MPWAIVGRYSAFCPAHKMNFLVLQALFADRSAYSFVEAPVQVGSGFSDFGCFAPVPAFAAEIN